jgi:uncharacterized repeat protein (TIGR03803 family)
MMLLRIAAIAALVAIPSMLALRGSFARAAFRLNDSQAAPNTYRETVLYQFQGQPDASAPSYGVVADASGSLYGVTTYGGTANLGAVFKLTPSGSTYTESIIYSFQDGSDGALPVGPLLVSKKGAIFGATQYGNSSLCGSVFRLTPSAGGAYREKTLYSFPCNSANGYQPNGGLITDATAALYGTTFYGGPSDNGVVFKLTPKGIHYFETVLHRFQGSSDGAQPKSGLVEDSTGALYGTTWQGGSSNDGTVFKLEPSGSGYQENVIYAFRGGYDGQGPASSLTVDSAGNVYGTTPTGGKHAAGIVFKLSPSRGGYGEHVLYRFDASVSSQPSGPVLENGRGVLYGLTLTGGPHNWGTLYKLAPSGQTYAYSTLFDFTSYTGGEDPSGPLIEDSNGALYGTAPLTSQSENGVVFKLKP